MPTIKLGLAPYKVSYYDPKTNVYLTLDNPITTLTYDDNTDLSGIAHGLFCQYPAIKLYEGKLPQKVIDDWKARYQPKGLRMAMDRAEAINTQSADVVTASVEKAQVVQEKEVSKEEVKEVVQNEVHEETVDNEVQAEAQEEVKEEAEKEAQNKEEGKKAGAKRGRAAQKQKSDK